jgi:hypothetical protein
VVLSGHDHDYERLDEDGIAYLVVGATSETRAFGAELAPGSIVRNVANEGVLLIEASAKRLTLQYQLRDGTIADTLTISPRIHR